MRRLLSFLGAVAVFATLLVTTPTSPASAENERAVILSPYATDSTFAASGQEPDVHAGQGDWAVDVYDGVADVYPNIVGATGAVTMTASVSNSCGTTGKIVTVSVKVDGASLGSVTYVHLDDVSIPANEVVVVTPSTKLGTTKLWTPAVQYDGVAPNTYLCWSVSSLSGVHVHMAAIGGSCYAGISGGSTIAADTPIAALGAGITAGSECTSAQLEVVPVDTDGDTVNDDIDTCPGVPGLVELDGCPLPPNSPVSTASGPAVVSDDILYVFGHGDDGELYYRKRPENAGWSNTPAWGDRDNYQLNDLSGTPSAVVSHGGMYIFSIGENGNLYQRRRDDNTGWGNWGDRTNPGVALTGSPSAVVSESTLYVFVRGVDGELYYRERPANAGWIATWQQLDNYQGNNLAGSPSAVVSHGGMYIFSIGENGNLYQRRHDEDTGWGPWGDRGKPGTSLTGSPSAVVNQGVLYVFFHGADGELYYRKRPPNAGWDSNPTWGDRGNYQGQALTGSPTAIVADGGMYVFSLGANGNLYQRRRDDVTDWGDWGDRTNYQGNTLTGSPSAVVSDGKTYVFAMGANGNLYQRSRPDGGGWSNWGDRVNPGNTTLLPH